MLFIMWIRYEVPPKIVRIASLQTGHLRFTVTVFSCLLLNINFSIVNKTMEHILKDLGLSALIQKFGEERIDEKVALSLSDSELIRLGVATIGYNQDLP